MKTTPLLGLGLLLCWFDMSSACNGHHDKGEWTKEELAEMQAKWGADVCLHLHNRLSVEAF